MFCLSKFSCSPNSSNGKSVLQIFCLKDVLSYLTGFEALIINLLCKLKIKPGSITETQTVEQLFEKAIYDSGENKPAIKYFLLALKSSLILSLLTMMIKEK